MPELRYRGDSSDPGPRVAGGTKAAEPGVSAQKATAVGKDVGKRCKVVGYEGFGTILFVGKHKLQNVIRVGVGLDAPVGKNNGTVSKTLDSGKIRKDTYFRCAPNHGVLVKLDKVSLITPDDEAIVSPGNKSAAISVYYVAVAIRLLLIMAPGYFHPDEHFQSLEIAARDVLGRDIFLPWEFGGAPQTGTPMPSHNFSMNQGYVPVRSISFPVVATHAPLYLMNKLAPSVLDDPLLFLATPRLWSFGFSLLCDAGVFGVAQVAGMPPYVTVAVWASAWPTMLLHTRPFSNTWETFWLCALFVIAGRGSSGMASAWVQSVGFGLVTAIAFFTRPTILAFGFPVGAFMLVDQMRLLDRGGIMPGLAKGLVCGLTVLATILSVSLVLVAIDSEYFNTGVYAQQHSSNKQTLGKEFFPVTFGGSISTSSDRGINWDNVVAIVKDTFVYTPLNHARFNTNTFNLKKFGIHPRYMHVGLNLQVLFGVMPLMLLWQLVTTGGKYLTQSFPKGKPSRKKSPLRQSLFRCMLLGSAVLGTAVLSTVPHQEARFLLPAAIGIVTLAAPLLWNAGSFVWTVVAVFNGMLLAFYGGVHQAGVVPTLVDHSNEPAGHVLAYYGVYMPPRSLLNDAEHANIVDFSHIYTVESYEDILMKWLDDRLCDSTKPQLDFARNVSVAISGGVQIDKMRRMFDHHGLTLAAPVKCHWPHFSGEYPPQAWADLKGLDIAGLRAGLDELTLCVHPIEEQISEVRYCETVNHVASFKSRFDDMVGPDFYNPNAEFERPGATPEGNAKPGGNKLPAKTPAPTSQGTTPTITE